MVTSESDAGPVVRAALEPRICPTQRPPPPGSRPSDSRVKVLLEAGGEVNTLAKDGWTPAYAAADRGHVECVKVLGAGGERSPPL